MAYINPIMLFINRELSTDNFQKLSALWVFGARVRSIDVLASQLGRGSEMNVLAVFFSYTKDPHGGCVQQLGVERNETLDELSDLRGILC